MSNLKLMQAVADISYIAGTERNYSCNSQIDISHYTQWATDFEQIHSNTDWDYEDYMLTIEQFATEKIKQALNEDIAFV